MFGACPETSKPLYNSHGKTPSLSVFVIRLRVSASNSNSAASCMARSSSALRPTKEEDEFVPDWVNGNEEKQDVEFIDAPDARASGEPSDASRARRMIDCIDSEFRVKFASMTTEEAKDYFFDDPEDFRQASMLQYLSRNGTRVFEEMHLVDRTRDAQSKASDARASGERPKFEHNQHKRKNAQALFSSAT